MSISTLTSIPRCIGQYCGLLKPAEDPNKVSKVAQRLFLELSVATGVNCAVLFFVATPMSVTVVTTTLAATAVWLLVETGLSLAVNAFANRTSMKLSPQLTQWAHWISLFSIVNTVWLAGPCTVLHETGHVIGGLSLYERSTAVIDQVLPFRAGNTRIQWIEVAGKPLLTHIGSLLGGANCRIAVLAAGVIATVAVAFCSFVTAHCVEKEHPEIARMLEMGGLSGLLADATYGVNQALCPGCSGDFNGIRKLTGIHPLAIVALMLLLPAVTYYLMKRNASD